MVMRMGPDEYTMAFLDSDWFYFLWHGVNVDIRVFAAHTKPYCALSTVWDLIALKAVQ